MVADEDKELTTVPADEKRLGIDPQILEEAKTKRSPHDRLVYFTNVYNTALSQIDPLAPDLEERLAQAENTELSIAGIKDLYKRLYHREIIADTPEVGKQFEMATKRHNGDMIPQIDMSAILEKSQNFASHEPDPEQLPE